MDNGTAGDGRPEEKDEAAWQGLWGPLGQAVGLLERQESFGLTELLASQPGMATWLGQASPSKCWAALSSLRLRPDSLPRRTRALNQALMMLLLDYGLSAAGGLGIPGLGWDAVWSPVSLADRLRHHYLVCLWGSLERPGHPGTGKAAQPAADTQAQERVALRWESELLPLAIGIVLSEGRVMLSWESWQDLAHQRVRQVLARANLNDQGHELVERLGQVLPEVQERLRERFQAVFQETEPARWEQLRPNPEEVAMLIRGRLYSLGAGRPCQGGGGARSAPGANEAGQEVNKFREALRALAAKGMYAQVARALEDLDQDLEAYRDDDLLSAGRSLGADAKVRAQLRKVLAGLGDDARPEENAPGEAASYSDQDLLAKAEALLKEGIAGDQVTGWRQMMEDIRRLAQDKGLSDTNKSLLAKVVAALEARRADGLDG